MDVVDALSEFQCQEIPMVDTTNDECNEIKNGNLVIGTDKLIAIDYVAVIDSNADTANDLNPVENTLIDESTTPPTQPDMAGDSSGSFGGVLALFSGLLLWRRKRV